MYLRKWLPTLFLVTGSLFATLPPEAPANFSLFINKGVIDHPVSTKNQEAQNYFNQGLTLSYAFNHDAAFWSFKKAAELDPRLAMAYWGMALSLGTNINTPIDEEKSKKAYEYIQKAIQLSNYATDNEKDYIQALAVRYPKNPNENQETLNKKYNQAMEKLTARYPDDLDAAALYAESGLDLFPWKQWDANGNPKDDILAVVGVLESILKKDPNHLGANHFYIHAIEASKYPERALMSAERLRHMLPSSGHIMHMPSHIYLIVGDYHLAATCNEEAIAVDRAYIQKFGMIGSYPLHYLSHNMYFLSRAYCMEGRFEDARRISSELGNFYTPHFEQMPDLEYYATDFLFVLLRFHKWEELLKVPAPNSKMMLNSALWHFARGMAYASLGNLDQAQEEQALFEKMIKEVPTKTKYGYNEAQTIMNIASLSLKAKVAEANGDIPVAIDFLQQAISIQDKLSYNEPPDWYFAIRESLGGIWLRKKQFKNAEIVFRQDLEKHPRNGRSLFGLLESLKGQNRSTDTFWIQREFDLAWRYSTVPLSIQDL